MNAIPQVFSHPCCLLAYQAVMTRAPELCSASSNMQMLHATTTSMRTATGFQNTHR